MSHFLAKAELLLSQGRTELAEKEIRRHLADGPDPAGLGILALCQKDRAAHDQALESARAAIALAPDAAWCHYVAAKVLEAAGRPPEAQQAIEEALRLDPEDADYWAVLAGLASRRKRWDDCIEAAEQGLEFDAEHVGCSNLRAHALVQVNRSEDAGLALDAVLSRDPENALSHANLGWTKLHSRDHAGALVHFREALRIQPDMEWAREGIVEALKARHVIYRVMLRYFFFMAKLRARAQFAIMIGALVTYQVVIRTLRSDPALEYLAWPIMGLYVGFMVMTWIAESLFDLVLRLHPMGRLALSREEIVASNWLGSCLLGFGVLGVVWLVTGSDPARIAAITSGLLSVPVSATFSCPRGGRSKLALGLYTLGMALTALMATAIAVVPTIAPLADLLLLVFVVALFLFTWVANFVRAAWG